MPRSILSRSMAIAPRDLQLIGLVLMLLVDATAHAQSPLGLAIDLAEQRPGIDVERPIVIEGRTDVSLSLLNAIPDAQYTVRISVDDLPIGVLSLSKPPASALPAGSAVHLLYGQMLHELDSAADELDVGRSALRSRRDVAQAYDEGGGFMLDSIDARTVHRMASVATVRPGEQMRVTVVRRTADGRDSARWTTTYSTAPTGEWQIGFGFAFPYVVGALEHYSVRRDAEGAYRVRASKSDDRISLVPAVYFSWIERDDRFEPWSLSLSGGVGFDMQNPVVLVGGALSFHQNITLLAGVAAHRVPGLDPEFAVGDILDERFASEDLVASRYAVDPFIGVGFRLLGPSLLK